MSQSHHSLNKLSDHEIAIRHTFHKPHSNQQEKYEAIRAYARGFAHMVNDLCPGGREASLAQTKIEEAVFWANAGIARRDPPPQPPISNEFVAPGCEQFSNPSNPSNENKETPAPTQQ